MAENQRTDGHPDIESALTAATKVVQIDDPRFNPEPCAAQEWEEVPTRKTAVSGVVAPSIVTDPPSGNVNEEITGENTKPGTMVGLSKAVQNGGLSAVAALKEAARRDTYRRKR